MAMDCRQVTNATILAISNIGLCLFAARLNGSGDQMLLTMMTKSSSSPSMGRTVGSTNRGKILVRDGIRRNTTRLGWPTS